MSATKQKPADEKFQNVYFGPDVPYDELIDKDIFELLGVQKMSDKEKEEILKDMVDTIQLRVFAKIDSYLSDKEAKKVAGFIESKDRDGFIGFIEDKGVDIAEIFGREALIYKAEMVSLVNDMDRGGEVDKKQQTTK